MKIRVWLLTRERATGVAALETLILLVVLLAGPGLWIRMLVGLPLLAHLGYTAMTALPMGMIPSRPEESKQRRRNQDLRSWVVRFLNEVKELEHSVEKAKSASRTPDQVEERLREGRRRVMGAAAEVAKAIGVHEVAWDGDGTDQRERISILTHAKPGGPLHLNR